VDAHLAGALGAVWFTACAWCQRIKVNGRWIATPRALELIGTFSDSEPQVTHGICPTCFRGVSAGADRERRLRRDPGRPGANQI
jgi:hypothetical protein